MKPTNLLLSTLLAAFTFAMVTPAPAQGWFGRAEGSRPGENYTSGRNTTPQQAPQAPQVQPQTPPYNAPQSAAAQQANPLEARGARPMILEFSDLQCPDSARFNAGLKKNIMARYVATGQAGFEWHDFPLTFHAKAPEAAAAARCAGSSADRMRLMIMENQGQMNAEVYTGYARQLKLDTRNFSACLRGGSSSAQVQNDVALGKSYGVTGTPFLVLGMKDAMGQFHMNRVVKAYDPPQKVLASIDDFLATAGGPARERQKK